MTLREDQIRRYARHVLLPDVGGVGQARLLAATVRIDLADQAARPAAIAAATYLAAAGIGTLVLTGGALPVRDHDVAAGIALGADDLGRPLGDALAARLTAINPDVRVVGSGDGLGLALLPLDLTPIGDAALADALVCGGAAACRLIHQVTAPPPSLSPLG